MIVPLRIAARPWQRLLGLFGKDWGIDELLIAPCRDIHTAGMRRHIDVAFINGEGRVIESHRDVAPWRRIRHRNAVAVIERFAAEGDWLVPGDHVGLTVRKEGQAGRQECRTICKERQAIREEDR